MKTNLYCDQSNMKKHLCCDQSKWHSTYAATNRTWKSIHTATNTPAPLAPSHATHCNTLQHTATHCNTLQHTATHCNTRLCHESLGTRAIRGIGAFSNEVPQRQIFAGLNPCKLSPPPNVEYEMTTKCGIWNDDQLFNIRWLPDVEYEMITTYLI